MMWVAKDVRDFEIRLGFWRKGLRDLRSSKGKKIMLCQMSDAFLKNV